MDENNKNISLWTNFRTKKGWTLDRIAYIFLLMLIVSMNSIAKALDLTDRGVFVFSGFLIVGVLLYSVLAKKVENKREYNVFGRILFIIFFVTVFVQLFYILGDF